MKYVLFDPSNKVFVCRYEWVIAWNDSHGILETTNKIQRAAKFSDAHTAVFTCEIINAISDKTFNVVNEDDKTTLFLALHGDPEDYREEMIKRVKEQYPDAHLIDACGVIVGLQLHMRFKRNAKSSAVYTCVRDEYGKIENVGGSFLLGK